MNKLKNLIWIFSIITLCILAFVLYNKSSKPSVTETSTLTFNDIQPIQSGTFSDGLNNPDSITNYTLDEFETGISEKSVYYIDINNDKKTDRITKTFIETGNAHSYYEYKIELNINNKYVDITPQNFRTTNGDTCDLQQIQFVFKPSFRVILINRELGETWLHPTMAKKQVFKLSNNELKPGNVQNLRNVCDVKELF